METRIKKIRTNNGQTTFSLANGKNVTYSFAALNTVYADLQRLGRHEHLFQKGSSPKKSAGFQKIEFVIKLTNQIYIHARNVKMIRNILREHLNYRPPGILITEIHKNSFNNRRELEIEKDKSDEPEIDIMEDDFCPLFEGVKPGANANCESCKHTEECRSEF